MPLFTLYVVICIVFDPKNQVPESCLSMTMKNNKFKVQTFACEVMAIVFWYGEEMLVEFLKRGATLNSERYLQILKKLKQRIRRIRPYRKMNQVLFLPTVRI
jgi:hypothetical protein